MADRKISQLTEQTAPAAEDIFPIVDVDEALSVDRNKKITFKTIHNALQDGTAAAPVVSFSNDSNSTGLFRSGTNELAFTSGGSYVAKVTTAGFQVGTGTAAAQFHLFSADTTDQVIIENTDAGADTAPDVVLYRNSASAADGDDLGNLVYRGQCDINLPHDYAAIVAEIKDNTHGSHEGSLNLQTAVAGTLTTRLRLHGQNIGIGETTPLFPLHITESSNDTGLFVESKEVVATSAADIVLYHHRNNAAGVAADVISSLVFQGNDDDGTTPSAVVYAKVQGSIVDPTAAAEDGKIDLQVMTAGTLTSQAAITSANVTLGVRPILPTHTPASATATGTAGEVAWDADYIYICTATNTWKRVAISTWTLLLIQVNCFY